MIVGGIVPNAIQIVSMIGTMNWSAVYFTILLNSISRKR